MEDYVKLNISGQIFVTKRSNLEKSSYLLSLVSNNNEVLIDGSAKAFHHILAFLRNSKYVIPERYLSEMKFYDIEYRKYGIYSDEIVTLNVSGTEFHVQANILMSGSTFFDERIGEMWIGTTLYIDRSIEAFEHILKRIYDDSYVIPYQYQSERQYYGVRPLNFERLIMIEVNNAGKSYKFDAAILMKSPTFKRLLTEHESIPPLTFPTKGFEQLMNLLMRYISSPLIIERKYKSIMEWAEIIPDIYCEVIYRECKRCSNIIKIICFRNSDNVSCYPRETCLNHSCADCNFPTAHSLTKYCDQHKCEMCYERVVDDKKRCKEHLSSQKGLFW